MPTTSPYALGTTGEGFPYCTRKIDLTDLEDIDGNTTTADYWITLGGTQKGSAPTAAEIHLSWTNALKLAYATYSITGSASATEFGFGGSVSVEDGEVRVGLYEHELTGVDEFGDPVPAENYDESEATKRPTERSCMGRLTRQAGTGDQPMVLDYSRDRLVLRGYGLKAASFYSSGSFVYGAAVTVMIPEIVRMYNGATSAESNFVGYGVMSHFLGENSDAGTYSVTGETDELFAAIWFGGELGSYTSERVCNGPFQAIGGSSFGGADSGVRKKVYCSWVSDERYYFLDADLNPEDPIFANAYRNITYTTFGGIPFVEVDYDGYNEDNWASADITSLDFYTR